MPDYTQDQVRQVKGKLKYAKTLEEGFYLLEQSGVDAGEVFGPETIQKYNEWRMREDSSEFRAPENPMYYPGRVAVQMGAGALAGAGAAAVSPPGTQLATVPLAFEAGATGAGQAYDYFWRQGGGMQDRRSNPEIARDAATEFGLGLGFNIGGREVARAGKIVGAKLAEPLRKAMVPGDAPQRLAEFEKMGVRPTPGPVTGSAFISGAQDIVSRTPFSGPLWKATKEQTDDIARIANATAERYGSSRTAQQGGRELQEGALEHMDALRVKQEAYEMALDTKVPGATKLPMSETRDTLKAIQSTFKGKPGAAGIAMPPAMRGILDDLVGQRGAKKTYTWQQARTLRKTIGEKANSKEEIVDGVSKAQWGRLYKAMTIDLRQGAEKAGAFHEFERTQRWADHITDVRNHLDALSREGVTPEAAYMAAFTYARGGDTRLNTIMKRVGEKHRGNFVGSVIRNMGKPNPSASGYVDPDQVIAQQAFDAAFEPRTFLTRLNDLSPEARKTLFSKYAPAEAASDFASLAKVSQYIKEADIGRNWSNSGHTIATIAGLSAAAGLGWDAATDFMEQGEDKTWEATKSAGALAALGGAYWYMPKLFASKAFTRWLTDGYLNPMRTENGAAAWMRRLGSVVASEPDISNEVAQFMANYRWGAMNADQILAIDEQKKGKRVQSNPRSVMGAPQEPNVVLPAMGN